MESGILKILYYLEEMQDTSRMGKTITGYVNLTCRRYGAGIFVNKIINISKNNYDEIIEKKYFQKFFQI